MCLFLGFLDSHRLHNSLWNFYWFLKIIFLSFSHWVTQNQLPPDGQLKNRKIFPKKAIPVVTAKLLSKIVSTFKFPDQVGVSIALTELSSKTYVAKFNKNYIIHNEGCKVQKTTVFQSRFFEFLNKIFIKVCIHITFLTLFFFAFLTYKTNLPMKRATSSGIPDRNATPFTHVSLVWGGGGGCSIGLK